MGRNWKKKGGRNKMGRSKKQEWSSDKHGGDTQAWVESVVSAGNAQMEAFYAAQGLHNHTWDEDGVLRPVADFEEWHKERLAWRQAMGRILPASFRIHRDLPQSLQKELMREFEAVLEECRAVKDGEESTPVLTHDGTGQPNASVLSFLPDNAVAYQLNLDRAVVRKHPRLKPLHEWLKTATDSEYITRQETVSMIPPAVLDPHPSDTVLDMCAAPGSKTCQLLEHVTGSDGCIVANDANPERAAVLTHQLKRVASRNPACLVTACPAQFFPASVTKFTEAGGFQKVLADVPCTGDGTSRKNIDVWRRWTVRNALSLHGLQLSIALRGVELLARNATVDAFLCYSTCSQSPIENEAVVAEILRQNSDLELVPVKLAGFRTRPGLTTWKVFDNPKQLSRKERAKLAKEGSGESTPSSKPKNNGTPADVTEECKQDTTVPEKDVLGRDRYKTDSMEEDDLVELAKQAGLVHYETFESVPTASRGRIPSTVFPPSDPSEMNLEHCVRVLPHDNDTGGFFVALLRKKTAPQSPQKKRARTEETTVENSDNAAVAMPEMDVSDLDPDNMPVSKPVDRTKDVKGAEAFVPLSDDLWNPLIQFYGLDGTPTFRKDCFMARVGSEAKVIHYVAPSIKAILDTGIQEKLYVLSGSAKAFTRNSMQAESLASHRVSQEAVAFVAPLMTKRKVIVDRDDFDRCLDRENVPLSNMSADFQEAVRPLSVGCVVVVLQDERLPADAEMLAVVAWRCRGDHLKLLVSQPDMDSIEKRVAFFLGPSKMARSKPSVANGQPETRVDNEG